jgi:Protein of unknown function (DUF2946)
MDERVIQAMAKWPNVPDCYGWLHLNAQGQWLIGETLTAGAMQAPSLVAHQGLRGFINRNYVCPVPMTGHAFTGAAPRHAGAWALQNGPQRVWVTLALAPFIVQVHQGIFTAHTGHTLEVQSFVLASDGVVYCKTTQGAGAIASSSMETFAQGVIAVSEDLLWQPDRGGAPIPMQPCDATLIEPTLGFTRNVQH